MSNRYLSFIDDEKLEFFVKKVINTYEKGIKKSETDLFSNVIDPFFGLFESSYHNISLEEWLTTTEKARKVGKTLANAIGEFHENILGCAKGWEKLPVGGVIDLKCDSKRIIAEVKNKFNTTKGNDKTLRYDDINSLLNKEYSGYTGYFVEIVPKNPPYDRPFTPPDNSIGRMIKNAKASNDLLAANKLSEQHHRTLNENIRQIDGRSFYSLVFENPTALEELYMILPEVIAKVLSTKTDLIASDKYFREFFSRAYRV
ncbi:MAG TPA: Eco47II family restriction endonuclease [Candidatus Pacebacteria bacterium]|nr:Eco47II family restriction endonuclease [Candidatus Paceibacterota bacterium]